MSALYPAISLPAETADHELAQRIRRHLVVDSRAAMRLQIEVDGEVVTLRGVASSFYQKQLWLHGTKRLVGDSVTINDEISVTPRWEESDFGWRD
jgi:hypothetical protein